MCKVALLSFVERSGEDGRVDCYALQGWLFGGPTGLVVDCLECFTVGLWFTWRFGLWPGLR